MGYFCRIWRSYSRQRSFRRISIQLAKMFFCGSATCAFGRRFVGKLHATARIALPTLLMARYVLLGYIYASQRLKLELIEFLAQSATVRTFRRRHHAVIDMTAFLTFPSCKSFHEKIKLSINTKCAANIASARIYSVHHATNIAQTSAHDQRICFMVDERNRGGLP